MKINLGIAELKYEHKVASLVLKFVRLRVTISVELI